MGIRGIFADVLRWGHARVLIAAACVALGLVAFSGCAADDASPQDASGTSFVNELKEAAQTEEDEAALKAAEEARLAEEQAASEKAARDAEEEARRNVEAARAKLDLTQDFRESFMHGEKPAQYQKYIMLHDTEGDSSASSVIDWWDSNGAGVAAHFVVNKDGSIVQAVPLDSITHHAGYGDAGHNEEFGVVEDGRDDMVGTTPIGSWAPDYGMNGSSIGIEIVHVGGSGDYPEAQLEALDDLIAYIDAYYGFESPITDHKAWRTGNSDTSPEFAQYLENYKSLRRHA